MYIKADGCMQDIVCWHRWQWETKRHLGAWRQVRLAPVIHLVSNSNQTSARRHILRQTRHPLFLIFRFFFMLFSKAAQSTKLWKFHFPFRVVCFVWHDFVFLENKICKPKWILIQREMEQGNSSYQLKLIGVTFIVREKWTCHFKFLKAVQPYCVKTAII